MSSEPPPSARSRPYPAAVPSPRPSRGSAVPRWRRRRERRRRRAALARALGATRAILVQPGGPARGTEAPPTPQLTKVEAAAAGAEHPAAPSRQRVDAVVPAASPGRPTATCAAEGRGAAGRRRRRREEGLRRRRSRLSRRTRRCSATTAAPRSSARLRRRHRARPRARGAPYICSATASTSSPPPPPPRSRCPRFVAASPGVDAAAVAPVHGARRRSRRGGRGPCRDERQALEKIAGPAPSPLRALPAAPSARACRPPSRRPTSTGSAR